MKELRSLIRSLADGIPLLAGVLLVSVLAAGCAPGSATRLVGVGCSDPSCEHEEPQTAKVLGCVGEGCNEPPPADAGSSAVAGTAAGAETSSEAKAAPVAAAGAETSSEAKAAPPAAAGEETSGEAPAEAKKDESSKWKVKVYYEPFQRD